MDLIAKLLLQTNSIVMLTLLFNEGCKHTKRGDVVMIIETPPEQRSRWHQEYPLCSDGYLEARLRTERHGYPVCLPNCAARGRQNPIEAAAAVAVNRLLPPGPSFGPIV